MSNFRTLRGKVPVSASSYTERSLILDDGLINQGYRVEFFTIWYDDPDAVQENSRFYGILATKPVPASDRVMDAADNRQIAWSMFDENLNSRDIIDPDHIVNRDLNLMVRTAGVDVGFVNYIIYLRKQTLTDNEAILTIVKEESQSID